MILGAERVEAALRDHRTAELSPRFSALLSLVERAASGASAVTEADVKAVRDLGYGDEAIYDALTVCALFAFYTTWVDSTGVPALPDYTPSGQRLAEDGYLPSPERDSR